jgi:hypothetical protein
VEPVRRGLQVAFGKRGHLPGFPPAALGIGGEARRSVRRHLFPPGRLPLVEPRAHPPDALQTLDLSLDTSLLGGERGAPIAREGEPGAQFLPVFRPHRRGAQIAPRFVQRGQRAIQGPRLGLPLGRQLVPQRFELFPQAAQAGNAAAGGKQRLGEIASGRQNRFGAPAQQMAVERKQALEQPFVGLADQPLQDVRIDAVARSVDQRVADAFAPADREGGAAAVDPLGEQPHAGIAEAERHSGLAGDAEQQVVKGLAQDRFAPAVRGHHEIDAARLRIEGQPGILEISVIFECERSQTHGGQASPANWASTRSRALFRSSAPPSRSGCSAASSTPDIRCRSRSG